ncbi:MAG: hypothetical protein ACE5KF_03250 [Kiloniellaceae bacterium]
MTKRSALTAALLAAALLAGLAAPASAHGQQGMGGQPPSMTGTHHGMMGMGHGMMDMHHGMMGMPHGMMGMPHGMMGMGHGMMGMPHGMMGMGHGMMGRGIGPPMLYGMPARDLSADDVRERLERRLAWHGNPRLKLGQVTEADDDTIVAEIVTKDGSLVQKLEIDRRSGRMRQAE